MRIGFVVNDVKTEEAGFTTIRLATAAVNQGHTAWLMGVGDLTYDPSEKVCARATSVVKKAKYKDSAAFLAELHGKNAVKERIMYFQLFPEEVRPRTLITRDSGEIKAFAKEQGPWAARPVIELATFLGSLPSVIAGRREAHQA